MQRLSTNLTLFFKIFVPTAWASFFGLFALVIFFLNPADEPFLTSSVFKIGFLVLFIIFGTLLYFTLGSLKRVEVEGDHLFVTNYFKTIRFPLENIKRMNVTKLGFLKLVHLTLHHKGEFGNKAFFLAKKSNFSDFETQYPEIPRK